MCDRLLSEQNQNNYLLIFIFANGDDLPLKKLANNSGQKVCKHKYSIFNLLLVKWTAFFHSCCKQVMNSFHVYPLLCPTYTSIQIFQLFEFIVLLVFHRTSWLAKARTLYLMQGHELRGQVSEYKGHCRLDET